MEFWSAFLTQFVQMTDWKTAIVIIGQFRTRRYFIICQSKFLTSFAKIYKREDKIKIRIILRKYKKMFGFIEKNLRKNVNLAWMKNYPFYKYKAINDGNSN